MSTTRIHDKFERFMDKVRSDNQPGIKLDDLGEEPKEKKVIGYLTYDFEKKTETYTRIN